MEQEDQKLHNISDKETLQSNLTFIALFVGMYEDFADRVQQRVELLLCDRAYVDSRNRLRVAKGKAYNEIIRKRQVDGRGHRDILKASVLWLVDQKVIKKEEYETFLELKTLRNRLTHQMSQVVWDGLQKEEIEKLMVLFDLYEKVDRWWLDEVELPVNGQDIVESMDKDRPRSFHLMAYQIMLEALYCNRSQVLSELLQTRE